MIITQVNIAGNNSSVQIGDTAYVSILNTSGIISDPIEAGEIIEINNSGDEIVDISKWRFSEGVRFQFPNGVTIYGMWDNVELHEGTVICYVAPRPDYRNRA